MYKHTISVNDTEREVSGLLSGGLEMTSQVWWRVMVEALRLSRDKEEYSRSILVDNFRMHSENNVFKPPKAD